MNWQIIVGIIFLIGGIGNITSNIGAFFFGTIVGAALILWGLKAKSLSTKRSDELMQDKIDSGKDLSRYSASIKFSIPKQYIIFDIETTGLSRTNDRIIEIAAIKYSHGEAIETFHSYVNPGRHIPNYITRFTGIHDADVQNAPRILEIKNSLLLFFGTDTLVGHNIKTFDIPFLEAQLAHHIRNNCIDTLQLSKQAFPGLPNYKLSVLDQVLQLGMLEHHRAQNDILVNNALFLACAEPEKYMDRVRNKDVLNNLVIEKNSFYPQIDIHSFTPTNPEAVPSTPLTGKSIAFSGELNLLREEAYQIAVDAGAILKSRVSRKVDYLVLGIVNPMYQDESGLSSKERTARQLINSGEANIEIIDESEFLRLASSKNEVSV